jgi:hypothetical protein
MTSASLIRGAPVADDDHRVHENLSDIVAGDLLAKISAIRCWSSLRTFTQNTSFLQITSAAEFSLLTQMSRTGCSRSADTEDIAEMVLPARPPVPSVVTTLTVLAVARIA